MRDKDLLAHEKKEIFFQLYIRLKLVTEHKMSIGYSFRLVVFIFGQNHSNGCSDVCVVKIRAVYIICNGIIKLNVKIYGHRCAGSANIYKPILL